MQQGTEWTEINLIVLWDIKIFNLLMFLIKESKRIINLFIDKKFQTNNIASKVN